MTVPCPFDLTGPYAYDLAVQVLWVDSIADPLEPTAEELATGIDLEADYDLTDIIGWEIETEILKDGEWGPFERQRLGGQSIADSRFMFAASRDGQDIRMLLARGQVGYVVILPSGPYLDYPDAPMNVYPVRVAQLTQQQRLRDGSGSAVLVTFAITALVGENVTVISS